ncbi:MAG: NADPH-dependent F420 reductase [Actinomycetota bacterium]|nr:NADPH-dependent F420 reductase [Actinomycetota bacterium]
MKIGILGGTGPAGTAMAARLASVGADVILGSRSVERAATACNDIAGKWADRQLSLTPAANPDAAAADLVIVATPWEAAPSTAASVSDHLDGKVVISMANALKLEGGEFIAVEPPGGSVAVGVQQAVPRALVAAAFHHLPARALADLKRPVTGDVLICADSEEAAETTAALVRAIPDLRPLRAGSLASAGAVEAFTAVLLGINRRYKARSSIRLAGLRGPNAVTGLPDV